jgi:hypothetical protein
VGIGVGFVVSDAAKTFKLSAARVVTRLFGALL